MSIDSWHKANTCHAPAFCERQEIIKFLFTQGLSTKAQPKDQPSMFNELLFSVITE